MRDDMKADEAASFLGKSESTLARWRRKGYGPAFAKIGGTYRYSAEAMEAFLRAQTRQPSGAFASRTATLLGAAA